MSGLGENDLTDTNYAVSAAFRKPDFVERRQDLLLNLYALEENDDETFDKQAVGGSAGIERLLTDQLSISAGLDYPGVGPEHAYLADIGRAHYLSATDEEALAAFQLCARLEGILPALEPSHALARVGDVARDIGKGGVIIMNLCGRGDKDVFTVADALGAKL